MKAPAILFIAFVALTSAPAPAADAPLYRVTLESRRPLKRAEAWGKSTELKRRGSRVEALVGDVHEVLWLRY